MERCTWATIEHGGLNNTSEETLTVMAQQAVVRHFHVTVLVAILNLILEGQVTVGITAYVGVILF